MRSGPVPGRYWELTFSRIIWDGGKEAHVLYLRVCLCLCWLLIFIRTHSCIAMAGDERHLNDFYACAQKYATLSCSHSPPHAAFEFNVLCKRTLHKNKTQHSPTHTHTHLISLICVCVCVIKVHFVAVHAANAQQKNSMWSLRFLCASTGCSLPQGTLSVYLVLWPLGDNSISCIR